MKLVLRDAYGQERDVLDRTEGVVCFCHACAGTVEAPGGWLLAIQQMHRGARYCVEAGCPEWAKWSFTDPPCVEASGHRTTDDLRTPTPTTPHRDAYRALDDLDAALAAMTYTLGPPDTERSLGTVGAHHTRALRRLVECHERGAIDVEPGPDCPDPAALLATLPTLTRHAADAPRPGTVADVPSDP